MISERLPSLFLWLLAIVIAAPIAVSLAPTLFASVTNAPVKPEDLLPPSTVYRYTPGPNIPLLGDFVWGVSMILMWVTKLPELFTSMLMWLGVPPAFIAAAQVFVMVALAAYLIYFIAGRVF